MRGEEIGRAEGGETGGMQIGAPENEKGRPEGRPGRFLDSLETSPKLACHIIEREGPGDEDQKISMFRPQADSDPASRSDHLVFF